MKRVPGGPFGRDDPVPDERIMDDYLDRLDPARFRVRGMFFTSLVKRLGADYASIVPFLAEPPPGKYVPFRSYPQHDHLLLLAVLAQREYGAHSHAEGMRRLAREDFHTFVSSTLGKVLMAMAGDPRAALAKLPAIYENVAPKSQRVRYELLPDGRVQLDFAPVPGVYSYQLGQIEEIVGNWDHPTSIEIWLGAEDRVRFVVDLD